MPTANERKALWFLALVALSGSAVRLWRAHGPPPAASEAAALDRQLARVDSARAARHKSTEARKGRAQPPPTAFGGYQPTAAVPVDLDRASAAEIEALPGIGPSLAQRIIANRDSAGSFGAIEALCDVRGIGSAIAERLRPLVTFTGPRRLVSAACGDASKRSRKGRSTGGRQPR